MSNLENKIDFTVLVKVVNANPNGDPINGNRPRTTYSGFGEISDVCIKRKIRNRLQDMGEKVFVQSSDHLCTDDCKSLEERGKEFVKCEEKEFIRKVCEKWIDVRMFGQVFPFKGEKKGEGLSRSVRGPVSIHQAISCSPIDINSMQITKCVNTMISDKKGNDTMGTKHVVEFGLYRIKGSINVQPAEKTGFSIEDANKLKEALRTLFVDDASSARPDGSMEVVNVYWWKHNNKIGQYSAAKVHDSLKISLKEGIEIPSSIEDYNIELETLPGLEPEIIQGI